jgi:glycosyltransferase involved in cell wall biosynthesis
VSASLVTIGLTCFNAADTIKRAIDSALTQDWPNFEVVIVDDNSTDGSADLVMATIANEQRARLIRHTSNEGPGAARNSILSNARGEFVAFFDDDDESLPCRVSIQLATLLAHEERTGVRLIACYASGIRRYPNGYTLALPAIGSRGAQIPNGADVADYLLTFKRQSGVFYGSGTPACSLFARRCTFAAVGDFDPELRRVEDADFAIRLALMGGYFVGTQQILFIQHSTGGNDKSRSRNLEAQQRLAYKHRVYLESIGRFEYAKRWPRLRYWHFSNRYGKFALEFLGLLVRYPLAVTQHLLATGPRRFWHERRIQNASTTKAED